MELGIFVDPVGVYKAASRFLGLNPLLYVGAQLLVAVVLALSSGAVLLIVAAFTVSPWLGGFSIAAILSVVWLLRPRRRTLDHAAVRLAALGVHFAADGVPQEVTRAVRGAVFYAEHRYGKAEGRLVRRSAESDARYVRTCARWRLRLNEERCRELNAIADINVVRLEELNRPFTVVGRIGAAKDHALKSVRRFPRRDRSKR